jgi:hypothetical protein
LKGLATEDVGIFYGHLEYVYYGYLVYFMVKWYIFSRFGMICQDKSGNPAASTATA